MSTMQPPATMPILCTVSSQDIATDCDRALDWFTSYVVMRVYAMSIRPLRSLCCYNILRSQTNKIYDCAIHPSQPVAAADHLDLKSTRQHRPNITYIWSIGRDEP